MRSRLSLWPRLVDLQQINNNVYVVSCRPNLQTLHWTVLISTVVSKGLDLLSNRYDLNQWHNQPMSSLDTNWICLELSNGLELHSLLRWIIRSSLPCWLSNLRTLLTTTTTAITNAVSNQSQQWSYASQSCPCWFLIDSQIKYQFNWYFNFLGLALHSCLLSTTTIELELHSCWPQQSIYLRRRLFTVSCWS